ncbi:MAG: site-specific integrase, partial [Opitutus sp.]
RRSELRELRWADFTLSTCPDTRAKSSFGDCGTEPSGGTAQLVEAGAVASVRVPASIAKNGRTALLPLGGEVVAELLAFRPLEAAPFQKPFATVPRCSTIRRDLARAGIVFVDTLGRRMDLHAMRKTTGTHLVLSGAQPRVVMEAMRHSDLKLTMKTYMDAQQLQGPVSAAVARLPWHREPAVQGIA